MENKTISENKSKHTKWLLIIIGIIIVAVMVNTVTILGYTSFGQNIITKTVCKQQPYQDTESISVQVPYQDTEYYTQTESGANCDSVSGCSCIHTGWWGLGSCDSCSCSLTRPVTKYRTETQQNQVTKLKDVCIKLKVWESPNYNENWLDYPELYDNQGNRIK